jgi:tetratricopeptide (TPR) repeat protein
MSYKKEDPDLYYMLGILLGKMERYPDSVDALNRAIALAPARADFVFYLGVIYEKTNEFEKCVAAMKQAAVLNPKHADALNYVGYIYAERGENLAEALEYVNKALEIDPNNAFYEDSLAWIYYRQKNLPLALETILKSVSHLKEKDATIYHHMGDVYFAMGKWEKSVEAYSISVGLKMDLEIMQKIENARNLADPTRAEKTNALIREKRASGRASEGMTGVIKK